MIYLKDPNTNIQLDSLIGTEHWRFILQVMDRAKEYKMDLLFPRIALSVDGQDLAVSWDVSAPYLETHKDYRPTLGAIRSQVKRVSTRLYGGLHYLPDDSGLIVMEKRIHKAFIENRQELRILNALDKWGDAVGSMGDIITEMEKRRLEPCDEYELLFRAARGRCNLMPFSWIGVVDKKWRKGPTTAWRLFTCFAEVAKRNAPLRQMRDVYGFYKLLEA